MEQQSSNANMDTQTLSDTEINTDTQTHQNNPLQTQINAERSNSEPNLTDHVTSNDAAGASSFCNQNFGAILNSILEGISNIKQDNDEKFSQLMTDNAAFRNDIKSDFAILTQKVDEINTRLSKQVDDLTEKFENLELRQSDNANHIHDLTKTCETINCKLESNTHACDEINLKVNTIETNVADIHKQIHTTIQIEAEPHLQVIDDDMQTKTTQCQVQPNSTPTTHFYTHRRKSRFGNEHMYSHEFQHSNTQYTDTHSNRYPSPEIQYNYHSDEEPCTHREEFNDYTERNRRTRNKEEESLFKHQQEPTHNSRSRNQHVYIATLPNTQQNSQHTVNMQNSHHNSQLHTNNNYNYTQGDNPYKKRRNNNFNSRSNNGNNNGHKAKHKHWQRNNNTDYTRNGTLTPHFNQNDNQYDVRQWQTPQPPPQNHFRCQGNFAQTSNTNQQVTSAKRNQTGDWQRQYPNIIRETDIDSTQQPVSHGEVVNDVLTQINSKLSECDAINEEERSQHKHILLKNKDVFTSKPDKLTD
ncbi:GATA zinc finger domain-containing protein 14-like [Schistocerca serialis cubense]|uniref:GATA zinc finger domain-containing protein 14-like n=1 Tax=Schistocerca serialis cubense TaxID=2023355 RepID=UPI00214E0E65|nr:GATA zinc finger domain-containing protein 14-like [Schistocerca serialis cubense]